MSETVTIDRPATEVFAFVADLRNFPLWRANLASSTVVSEQPTGLGARCEERIQLGPGRIPATCQIVSLSPGRTFTFSAVSPGLVYDGRATVDPDGEGSAFTLSGDVTISGPLRVLEPVIRRRMEAGVRSEVAAIREHLEAGSATP